MFDFGNANDGQRSAISASDGAVLITAGPGTFSSLIGHKAENKQYFADKYPRLRLIYREDPAMNDSGIHISAYNEQNNE